MGNIPGPGGAGGDYGGGGGGAGGVVEFPRSFPSPGTGRYPFASAGGEGGFGGGGGGGSLGEHRLAAGGVGGFGGGGAGGRVGGFGGGSGGPGVDTGGGGGAGLGGGVFVRYGTLYLIGTTFAGNAAAGGDGGGGGATAGRGLGGAVFVNGGAVARSLGAAPAFAGNAAAGGGPDAFGPLQTDAGAALAVTGGSPQGAAVAAPFPAALRATLVDGTGNPVPGAVVRFAAPAGGAGATLSAGEAVTDAGGRSAVTATANRTPGSYAVTAAVGGLSAGFDLTNAVPPVVVSGPGSVVVLNPVTGQRTTIAAPFGSIPANVAVGDLTGDGVDDFAFVPTAGGGPVLNVVNGATGQAVVSLLALPGADFRGGLTVAVGNGVVGPNRAGPVVAVGAGNGGGPIVRLLDPATGAVVAEFFAFDPDLRTGVSVALADVTGDGVDDLIVGTGGGAGGG